MICQTCGVEAPTRYVSFHQNVGMLVMRRSKSIEGFLCKSCIHRHFWSMTGTNLFLGWWGTISFFITPFLILNNVGRYLFCLGMPGTPPDAERPVLTDEAVSKIKPQAQHLFDRLNAGDDFPEVVQDVAERANVPPAQVALFVQAVVRAQQQNPQK